MKQDILQHTRMTVREHESIPVDPLWILGIEVHVLRKQNVGNGSHAHRGTWVPRLGLGGDIDSQCSDAGTESASSKANYGKSYVLIAFVSSSVNDMMGRMLGKTEVLGQKTTNEDDGESIC